MNKQEFNGKTLDEALSAAARALGTDVTLLSYNILPQSSGGLFSKLFQRGVRLEAWVDTSNDVQAAAREAVRQARADAQDQSHLKPTPQGRDREHNGQNNQLKRTNAGRRETNLPRPQRAESGQRRVPQDLNKQPQTSRREKLPPEQQRTGDAAAVQSAADRLQRPRFAMNSNESRDLLRELADQFIKGFDPGIEPAAVEIQFLNEDDVVVTVQSPTLENFLVKSDRLSCAFEHLFKRIAQRKFGDVSGRVTLNAGGASFQREEKLRQMALDIAAKVKETGKTMTLSSKSSQERRVIHLALENMEGIATKSVGIGDNRKLIIYSTNRPPRDDQQRKRHPRRQHQARGSNAVTPSDSTNTSENFPQPDGQPQNDGYPPRRQRRRGRRGGGRLGRQNGASPDDNANSSAGPEHKNPESSQDADV